MKEKMKLQNKQKGITLIALVVTIVVLLILVGVSVTTLAGQNGILTRTVQAKLNNEIGQVKEIASLKILENTLNNNVDNQIATDDETIKTAVINELVKKGYQIETRSTSTRSVNGLLIQDSTGKNIDQINTNQNGEITLKVSLDTTGTITTKTLVKIQDKLFELIISNGNVELVEEESIRALAEDNTYEIKLTPPTNGITLYVGNDQINTETLPIVPGSYIKVKAGETTGTFTFNVTETTTSVNKTISTEVKTAPENATGLSLNVKNNAPAEIAPGRTLQIEATKTPEGSTDIISWSIKSGSATIDKKIGLVTANSDAQEGSTIVVEATCVRADNTTTTVEKQTITLTVKAIEEEGSIVDNKTKVGYYADIDGIDGVDGVIYADLAVGGSGQWGNDTYGYTSFTIPTKTGLKEYYIKQETYNDGHFGAHPVIAPKEGTSGEDRFYVMALSDVSSSYYYWDKQYHNIFYGTEETFESGKENTRLLINYWNEHNYNYSGSSGKSAKWHNEDVWLNIQNHYNKGWFVPSKEEWSAFGKNLGITRSNYSSTFGLSFTYWSSSQYSGHTYDAWGAGFGYGSMGDGSVYGSTYVRLSTTF